MDSRLKDRKPQKSARSNLIRTVVVLASGVLTQPLLLHWLSPSKFVAYTLVVQLGTMLMYLDLGIQVTMTREIAASVAVEDMPAVRRTLSVGTFVQACVLGFGMLALFGAVLRLHDLYPKIGDGEIRSAQFGLAIVGFGSVFALLTNGYVAFLTATQQINRTIVASLVVRVVGLAGILVGARFGLSLVVLAAFSAGTVIFTALIAVRASRSLAPGLLARPGDVNRKGFSRVARSSAVVSTSTVGLLLIGGLDLAVVGHYDAPGVRPYAPIVSLLAALLAMHSAVFAPIVPSLTETHTSATAAAFLAKVRTVMRMNAFTWCAVAVGSFALLPEFLKVWLGNDLGVKSLPIAQILMISTVIRYSSWSYTCTLIAIDHFRPIKYFPLLEGTVNLVASLLLAKAHGAVGVAWGSFAGAVAGVVMVASVGLRRTREVFPVPPREFLTEAVFVPLLIASPLILNGVGIATGHLSESRSLVPRLVLVVVLGFWSVRRWRSELLLMIPGRLRPAA